MTTLTTYGTVTRDGVEWEIEVEGDLVKGHSGSWEEPPEPPYVEDVRAWRTDNPKLKVELTDEEVRLFSERLLENFDPSDHEPDYEED